VSAISLAALSGIPPRSRPCQWGKTTALVPNSPQLRDRLTVSPCLARCEKKPRFGFPVIIPASSTAGAPNGIRVKRDESDRDGSGSLPAVVLERVSFAFDDHVVLRDVSFEIQRGSMAILLGASGSGKSVLLKLVLGLLRPDSGRIYVNGQRIDDLPEDDLLRTRAGIGMVFQELALFDSLTVNENVGYRLYEETDMPQEQVRRRVEEVLQLIGLSEYIDRMPSALSGGQRRRVALARALAPQPNLMLLDDPTTGLDPILSTTVDDAIVTLRDLRQVTSLLVTHQIRDAFHIATHRALPKGHGAEIVEVGDADMHGQATFRVLHQGRIHFEGTPAELLASNDPYLREFLFMTLPPW
jgi:phospholipid/cholesterol/gamma-HCH transport system ATP-binding protein